jgi:hypothetical protein
MLALPNGMAPFHDDDVGGFPGLSARTGDETPFGVVVSLLDHSAVALFAAAAPDSGNGYLNATGHLYDREAMARLAGSWSPYQIE